MKVIYSTLKAIIIAMGHFAPKTSGLNSAFCNSTNLYIHRVRKFGPAFGADF